MRRAERAAAVAAAAAEEEEEVPAAVRAAVEAFAAPRGFEDFPAPTKNSAQRSLIYAYGRRVRRRLPTADGAAAESKWFCLASAQCRANRTAIRTSANTSGCTRHLQAVHGLVSPKTAAQAAAGTRKAPPRPAHDGGDDGNDDGHRAARSEWTRVMVVRHLLPLAALASDAQVARLTTRPVAPGEALRHLAECYAATRARLRGLLRHELERAALPVLHVGVLSAGVPGSPGSCARGRGDTTALALVASLVTSAFRRQQFVLAVAHVRAADSQPRVAAPGVLRWLAAVLGAFGVAGESVRAVVLEQASPLGERLAAALATGGEAERVGLASTRVEFSCDSVAVSALSAACARGSCLSHLVVRLLEIAACSDVRGTDIDAEPLEELASRLGGCSPGDSAWSRELREPSTWLAVGCALRWVVRHWRTVESAQARARGEQQPSTMPETLALARADLRQSLAILQPVLDSLRGEPAAGRARQDESAGCPEAVVGAFAARLSALNELEPLQLAPVATGPDRDTGGLGDTAGVENKRADDVRPADVTGFARKLRHELASQWDVAVQEGICRADNACLATFLHPCFRHLEFMDAARRAVILEQAKVLGQLAVVRQRRRPGPAPSSPTSVHPERSNEAHAGSDLRLSKKRKAAAETDEHERLTCQAETLARLGLLRMARPLAAPSEHSVASSASSDDQSSRTTSTSPALLVASELERYMKSESVAFQAVAFDGALAYWDRKTLELPILAAVAQAVSGAPRSLRAACSASAFAGRGGCCVRCSLHQCQLRELSPLHSGRRLHELLHFLHLNEQFVPATSAVPPLTRESIVRVLEELEESSSALFVDAADL